MKRLHVLILITLILSGSFISVAQIKKAEITYKFKLNKTKATFSSKRVEMIYEEAEKIEIQLFYENGTSWFGLPNKLEIADPVRRSARRTAESLSEARNTDYIYDVKKHKVTRFEEFEGELYAIDSDINNYDWKLENVTKKINNQVCYKATRIKKVIDRTGKTNSVQIIAWYSPEINIPIGPKENVGLPGLILELEEVNRRIYYISEIKLNIDKVLDIEVDKTAQNISQEEFTKITNEAYKSFINSRKN